MFREKNVISQIWLYFFFLVVCLDFALTFFAKNKQVPVDNSYYQLNLKYGFVKISVLKCALALLESWFIIVHRLSNGRTEVVLLLYFALILKLFFDVARGSSTNAK